jgi:uncharacterized RDD family membrane protein YckC
MTEPVGGPPAPGDPGETPAPPPAQSGWQAPPQVAAPGGFGAPVAAGPAPGVTYADLVMRIVAYIIDSIIFFIVAVVLGSLIVLGIFAGGGVVELIGTVLLVALSLVGSAIYFVYFWTTMRASPGQKMLSLETVNAADGATLTRDQAIRRWAFLFGPFALGSALGYAPGVLGVLGSLVGLLAIGYALYLLYSVSQSPKRQGFHDVQAATVVVKRG